MTSMAKTTLTVQVPEMRTKWERLHPKDEDDVVTVVKNNESIVRSRVQRYNVTDSKNISKQTGYINTINTARVYSNGEQPTVWVVHNKLGPNKPIETYTSFCHIQPSCNK